MKISSPCIITARLLPGIKIGATMISIEYGDDTPDGRQGYIIHIDGPGLEYTCNDLASGVGGGSLQEGLESALGFMHACGESVAYTRRTGRETDNADLFPPHVGEWCDANSDELGSAEC